MSLSSHDHIPSAYDRDIIPRVELTFKRLGIDDFRWPYEIERLKTEEIPVIYHYTKMQNAELILQNATLKYGEIGTLNDSFEMDFNMLDHEIDKQGYIDYMKTIYPWFDKPENIQKANEVYDKDPNLLRTKAKEGFEMLAKDSGIISFSRSYNIKKMWSHYGQCEAGVSLGFKMSAIKAGVVSRVKYVPKMIKPKYYDTTIEALLFIAFIKSTDWAEEEEVRAFCSGVSMFCDERRCDTFDKDLLTSIYFGVKASDDDKQRIIGILKSNNYPKSLKMYQMRKDPNDYRYLEPEEIEY